MLRAIGLTIVIAVCAFGAGLAVPTASAASTVLSMDSITITPGGGVTLDLNAESIPTPGLGAWSVAVVYDPAILTALSCESVLNVSLCNAQFADNRVQIAGASSPGHIGSAILASITFICDRAGVSDLAIIVTDFADATEGGPVPISFKLINGTIACSPPSPEPTHQDVRGDADCNGVVTSRDALLVLQYTAGFIDTVPCFDLADVDQNGRVDAIDASLIKQIDAGLISP